MAPAMNYPGTTCGHKAELCSHRFAIDSAVIDSLEADEKRSVRSGSSVVVGRESYESAPLRRRPVRQEQLWPMESPRGQPSACLRKALSEAGLFWFVFRARPLAQLRILVGRRENPESLQFKRRQNEQKAVIFSCESFRWRKKRSPEAGEPFAVAPLQHRSRQEFARIAYRS
jgi:hypothetical protein